ncbi:uncharacterized protein TRIVIDRAFT_227375 [Trichoderma virens Gv29-8]|uniref:DUF1993 domain-containing protein n=1 Tax=Hypocrea virens (strain Gv29-8 / FGSC 10586) TaxID=413071 RepID=G9N994_HYPVG|nr:uncharacterized protein TRIVIDRAFT_227375 [Trichoderma virens Gv29-8]EHK16515.1 hypothetical protein TRIVIDRAFT_227375 [Trichoderma virens Gv29-8]UKZ52107.1 hypothetical protein TrVGV298_005880 [Trichoderma virens]UKZ77928.1 hypothetical protein TrVFT333_005660 [Trichoderma virens FT-333]
MAPPTLYQLGIDPYIRAFETFKAIFQKAKEHAGAEADSFVTTRLYADMYPLTYQIWVVYAMAASVCLEKLLLEIERPEVGDHKDLKTMDDLIACADKGLKLMRKIKPGDLEGVEDKIIEFSPRPPMDIVVTDAMGFALGWTTPNLYFHLTTAYALLRMKGVPLGKMDFWMPMLEPFVHSRHKYAKEEKEVKEVKK